MTYQQMLDTRPARLLAAEKRKAELLANADSDQMETDQFERDEFEALSD